LADNTLTTQQMAAPEVEAPETIEGYWVLHDFRRIDWPRWRSLPEADRSRLLEELLGFLGECASVEGVERGGSSRAYRVITQKADLAVIHFRPDPAQLFDLQAGLWRCGLADFLVPAYSYFSVIELSLYRGPSSRPEVMERRLYPRIPDRRYMCFYPMNKRRGERYNWYDLPASERREMMKGHGRVGHKYSEQVTQVITGSQGLDDWEWGVTLFADHPIHFKKLVYEMRFDPASSRYAEFGPFYIGMTASPQDITALLLGS